MHPQPHPRTPIHPPCVCAHACLCLAVQAAERVYAADLEVFLTSWLNPIFTLLSAPPASAGPATMSVWAQLIKAVSDILACSRELVVQLRDADTREALAVAVGAMRHSLQCYPRYARAYVSYAAVQVQEGSALGWVMDKVRVLGDGKCGHPGAWHAAVGGERPQGWVWARRPVTGGPSSYRPAPLSAGQRAWCGTHDIPRLSSSPSMHFSVFAACTVGGVVVCGHALRRPCAVGCGFGSPCCSAARSAPRGP
jgi:hypothetical protein